MARVRPFAAFRYGRPGKDISAVTAPPYDVISAEQRAALLASDPDNIVALELPQGDADPAVEGNRYAAGAATWADWRRRGVMVQDTQPAVYVLEQRFTIGEHPIRRRALVVEVALEPFEAGVVLPHERTLPKALGDRFELTKATAANLSPVFGLFEDALGETDPLFADATRQDPVSMAVDADGVTSSLWAMTDPKFHADVQRILADKQIFIADGHHRYTTALAYRDLRRTENLDGEAATADRPYDFVMMALVNMDDPELCVLATHRAADAPGAFDGAAFWRALARDFTLEALPPAGSSTAALEGSTRPAFIVKVSGDETPRRVRLRDDVDLETAIDSEHSSAWKHLDVAVLQELILEPLLDIHPDRPETLDRIWFIKDADVALGATEDHDVVFIMRPTRMEQLREVALAGETMPQKSTYFFPKLLSGMLLRSAD